MKQNSEMRRAPVATDMTVDLSGLPLVDLTREQILGLAKPRSRWEEVAEQVVATYPEVSAELGLGKFEPGEAIVAPIALVRELAAYEAWFEKKLEMVRETRLKAASDAWRAVLKVYRRANDVGIEDPRIAKAFRFVGEFLTNETREAPTATTAPTNANAPR